MKYEELKQKYPKFIYEKYSYNVKHYKVPTKSGSYKISGSNLEIFFDFKIEPNYDSRFAGPWNFSFQKSLKFRPKIIIEKVNPDFIKKVGNSALKNLIFNLGLMEIPSYWKVTCSPKIEIQAGSLNSEQIHWWEDLIIKGMGQFFYENKIDFRKPNFLKITSPKPKQKWSRTVLDRFNKRVLVPVGGGKDSIVTLELLKKTSRDIRCFDLNPTDAAMKIMKIAGCKRPIIVKRRIDQKLLELNRRGFLNGHTPFSAYLAFLSVLIAAIFDYKYIAFSNERSSNEGNIKYLGKIINHQWSKSFEFEKKFRSYTNKYLAKNPVPYRTEGSGAGIEYFSFLRPLYEIQIAKLFSHYPKYFNSFLSCNEAYKTASGTKKPTRKWCGKCSKCLFVFTILYPFVKGKELLKILKKNLFEDKKLLPIMKQLVGERGFKPFECVGTKKESLIAFYLSWKKYRHQVSVKLPFLLRYFEKKMLNSLPRGISSASERFLRGWSNQNNLPKGFENILKSALFAVSN